MHHETLEYFDGQQKLLGELFYDETRRGPGKNPNQRQAILVFPAFEGRGEFALTVAQKLAEQGYIALAVDMYGDGVVAQTLDECLRLISPFLKDRSLVRKRALLAYSTLKKFSGLSIPQISGIGFCFGGMCVLEIARSGEALNSAISVHGVLSKSDLPNSTIKSKILIIQGYRDPQVPADILPQFAQEMEAAGSPDWVFTYLGHAKHSFTDIHTGSFDPAREQKMGREYNQLAAERAFQYSLDFLRENFDRQD